jgi:hypothetical protein
MILFRRILPGIWKVSGKFCRAINTRFKANTYFFFLNGDVSEKNTKNKPQTDRPLMTEHNMVHAG